MDGASDMSGKPILTRLDDGVLTITMNRPEILNALSYTTSVPTLAALREAEADPAVRAVVFTGAGRAFCAGADVRDPTKPDENDPLSAKYAEDPRWHDVEARNLRVRRAMEIVHLLHNMGKPTIASVRGPAVGAGFGLALACDFRIASDTAYFVTRFAELGLSGDNGAAYFLTTILGPTKARELMFLSEKVDADEALRLGLVSRKVADAELEAQTLAFARRLADAAPVALNCMKQNLLAAEAATFDHMFDLECRNMVRTSRTEDAREAMTAFREKRKPVFIGR